MRIIQGSVQHEIMTLIDEAKRALILVSPYLSPWQRLTAAIERARVRGVAIFLILRGGEDRAKQEAEAAPLRPFLQSLLFIERLHAKVYLSESAAVLTSMNLVESSATNSIEFAAYMTQDQDADSYQQTVKLCESLIAIGMQDQQRGGGSSSPGLAMPSRESVAKTRATSRRSTGHCIRCGEDIASNPEKPLCGTCYKKWAKYEDPDYEEKFCHGCGRKHATSLRKPLCRTCYSAAA